MEQKYTVESLKQDPIFTHFYQLCQIPHGSGNEQEISRYLYEWASGLEYEVRTDDAYNIFLRVPASAGYEERPAVMLQAHMDMVCEKTMDSVHDFAKDPIPWMVDGDFLTTGGETTLGADDGIGIALVMALLSDKEFSHPDLEILFTTNEEEDFNGASTFDIGLMRAPYLINLDHVREGETLCGSCGGMRVDMRVPVERKCIREILSSEELQAQSLASYKITVEGLIGGHSGEDIHRGRGNANVLMGRILRRLRKECEYLITDMKGGSFRLAIPREASVTIAAGVQEEEKIRSVLEEMQGAFQKEMSLSGKYVKVRMKKGAVLFDVFGENKKSSGDAELTKGSAGQSEQRAVAEVLQDQGKQTDGEDSTIWGADPDKILTAIALTPDGIFQLNEAFEGIVDTSDNLGEIYLEGDQLHFVLEIRSATESLREELFEKMSMLAHLLGGEATYADAYPSWDFQADSYFQRLSGRIYKEQTGKDMQFLTVHAGLEVGYFLEKKPGVDAVAIGPDIRDFHSPSESVSIASTKRVYEYMKELIRSLGEV